MKYKYLLLDADGTLLNFTLAQQTALTNTFSDHGIPATDEMLELYDKINREVWMALERKELTRSELVQVRFTRLFSKFGVENIDIGQFNSNYISHLANGFMLVEGAFELLEKLSVRFPMAIITNGKASTQYKRLAGAGIDRFFKHIIISEELGYEKPDPAFFSKALEICQITNKEDALIIGDSLTADIGGGIGFGIDTCWYNPHLLPLPADIKPTFVVNSLSEIPGILEFNKAAV